MSIMKTDRPIDLHEPAPNGKRSKKISNKTYNAEPGNFLGLLFHRISNSVVPVLISFNVFVALWFAFKTLPISAFHLHIGLCVIGYQLFMSNAIICLNENNVWMSYIPMSYRMRLHLVLHILGSVLAITGSIIMMKEKSVHFNTIHGRFALAALVLTGMSLINGTISLLSNGRINNIKIAKIFHVLCGMITFILSSTCLSFGFYKNSFKSWASEEFTLVMICGTCIYTGCVIFKPSGTILKKLSNLSKTKKS